MDEHRLGIFIFLFILFLTIIIIIEFTKMHKKEGFQEGFDIGKEISKAFNGIGDKIQKPFTALNERLRQVGIGFKDIFTGIGDEFVGIGNGLRLGFEDIGLLFEYTGEFSITYILCAVKFIKNLSSCFFYYMVDTILKIFYLPIKLFLFIISLCGLTYIYEMEKIFFQNVNSADGFLFNLTGISMTRWPKDIRNLCYNCKRLKVEVLTRKAKEVNNDFNYKMPEYLQKGITKMDNGAKNLLKAFSN